MNIQEQKVKQLEGTIIMKKAEMWQLTSEIQSMKKQIAARQAEEVQLVAQLNQLKLEMLKQQAEGRVEKLDETALKPTLVDRPITSVEGRQN